MLKELTFSKWRRSKVIIKDHLLEGWTHMSGREALIREGVVLVKAMQVMLHEAKRDLETTIMIVCNGCLKVL